MERGQKETREELGKSIGGVAVQAKRGDSGVGERHQVEQVNNSSNI